VTPLNFHLRQPNQKPTTTNRQTNHRRDPRQRWQVAAACLRHCSVALAALPPALQPDLLLARPPPGAAVVESALSGGAVFHAIMHLLQPGEEELEVGLSL
jgi:hypothetical protein